LAVEESRIEFDRLKDQSRGFERLRKKRLDGRRWKKVEEKLRKNGRKWQTRKRKRGCSTKK